MTHQQTGTDMRRDRAERGLADLGIHRSDHQLLGVQCSRGHHVAAVYKTDEGRVYQSVIGPHSHGSKDFIDTGKSGSRSGTEHADLLVAEAWADDNLPAWCDCGPRTLSRAELLGVIRAGEHLVRVP